MEKIKSGMRRFRLLVRLTRYREHVHFVALIALLGAILADVPLDWRLGVVFLGNFLVACFAFMVNEIEDAPDDARDNSRTIRNPVATGELPTREAWIASWVTVAIAMMLYSILGVLPLALGAATVLLVFLYSWQPVRLKARPVVDLLTHILPNGLQLLTAYLTYVPNISSGRGASVLWASMFFIMGISAYGELYNQLRDLHADTQAGVRTTAALIGEKATRASMYSALAVSFGLIVYSVVVIGIRVWVMGVALLVSIVVFALFMNRDARGDKVVDFSGSFQLPVLFFGNTVLLLTLVMSSLQM